MVSISKPTRQRDAHAALVCGEGFQRLAEQFIHRIAAIHKGTPHPGSLPTELGHLVACATNLAFAIELYLKALLVQLGLPVPQTHDLRALYDAIPQPVSTLIESVYDTAIRAELGRRVSITLAKGPPDEPLWDAMGSPGLSQLLERSKDLFQSWRYIFEFTHAADSPYQFHRFDYGLLWWAAEAVKAEIEVRSGGAGEPPPTNASRAGTRSPEL